MEENKDFNTSTEHEHSHTHTNAYPHQAHHHHHDHQGETDMEKLKALLNYMASHNADHTHELEHLAEHLKETGNVEAYELAMEAVKFFSEGNEKLKNALECLKKNRC